jgi:SAM-dependent methyltransferase
MLPALRDILEVTVALVPIPEPVVEFGSYQVDAASGIADFRELFAGRDYIGADFRPGPGVDRILDLHDVELPDASVGTVVVMETLEHVRYPWRAAAEIHRILRGDGIVVLSVPFHFPVHNHPNDYWRFTTEGVDALFEAFPARWIRGIGSHDRPTSVFGILGKSASSMATFEGLDAVLGPHLRTCLMAATHLQKVGDEAVRAAMTTSGGDQAAFWLV